MGSNLRSHISLIETLSSYRSKHKVKLSILFRFPSHLLSLFFPHFCNSIVSLLSPAQNNITMVAKCIKCGFTGKGLFSWPKEEKVVAEWFTILLLPKEELKSHCRVCFKHFSKQDYYIEANRFVLRKAAKPLGPGDYSSEDVGPLEAARAILPKDTRIVVLPRARRLQCQVIHLGLELSLFVSVLKFVLVVRAPTV